MLVDSHCHLDYHGLAEDTPAVLARAKEAGVGLFLTISTRVAEFDKIKTLIEAHDNVFGTVGTHPNNASDEQGVTTEQLIALASHPKIVGFGEAGLDYHYDSATPQDQQQSAQRDQGCQGAGAGEYPAEKFAARGPALTNNHRSDPQ